jgi:hypothetical protein
VDDWERQGGKSAIGDFEPISRVEVVGDMDGCEGNNSEVGGVRTRAHQHCMNSGVNPPRLIGHIIWMMLNSRSSTVIPNGHRNMSRY